MNEDGTTKWGDRGSYLGSGGGQSWVSDATWDIGRWLGVFVGGRSR